MEDIIIPIFMCVVMPIAIVWLVMRTKLNETDKMAEIMIKALEAGTPIDPSFFKEQPLHKTIKEKQVGLLTGACIVGVLGLGLIIIGVITSLVNGWTYLTAPSAITYASLAGGVLVALGLALYIAYLLRKRLLTKEIEAEEKTLETSD